MCLSGVFRDRSDLISTSENLNQSAKCNYCDLIGLHDTSEHKCQVCGMIGLNSHSYVDCKLLCTICDGFHTTENHKCFLCMKSDHDISECPVRCTICKWFSLHKKENHRCMNCGLIGSDSHISKHCPQLEA